MSQGISNFPRVVSIHDIPPELLQHIFSLSCDIRLPSGFGVTDTLRHPLRTSHLNQLSALTLSHVCRRWHKILLSCPILWSKVEMRGCLGDLDERKIEACWFYTKLYLERSKALPLTIILEFVDTFSEDDGDNIVQLSEDLHQKAQAFLPVYKLLFGSASRWRSLHICVPARILHVDPFSERYLWPDRLPIIRHLSIHIMGNRNTMVPQLKLREVPQLQSLIQTGHEVFIVPEGFLLAAEPLESLHTAVFTGGLNQSFLHLASSITSMTICDVQCWLTGRYGSTVCLAKALHLFSSYSEGVERTGWMSDTLDYLTRNFTLPNLVELCLEMPLNVHQCVLVQRFKTFLKRKLSLTHLSLINVFISSADVLDILALLPSLTHLAMGSMHSDSEEPVVQDDEKGLSPWPGDSPMLSQSFFDALADPNSAKAPRLVELHFGFRDLDADVSSAFLGMIEARRIHRSQRSTLQYVQARVNYVSAWGRLYRQFDEMCEGGILDFDWVTSSAKWRSGFGVWKIKL
ncbi:hypothetical protein D9758_008057 [Tetrapyrgos nigripes]|uniref:F-box domain-containing protein n=1 Tax=Tetrapyrgos nigripes TaxID=182062 RepID=A0A8H5D0G1_9AGAR|nr:hypothetical protein D9758_008057 [Tetrapyrgos nigripes]